ncbi:hypothetical protein amb1507 [Paramagnetospirillum magneticum AMB-1]|uniref:Uncharacterized protein n=1 Tax=Paramagnetospirillum magneticum (strain ATCC 700264 / AMB-1) TaxID=342108 RepID=Q2W764_PARM1|nr:hypothetical protein amb1507 [Paramagnetospirillum magneticum AMB-1]
MAEGFRHCLYEGAPLFACCHVSTPSHRLPPVRPDGGKTINVLAGATNAPLGKGWKHRPKPPPFLTGA